MAVEMTSETFEDANQLFGMKLVRFTATSANDDDYITFTGHLNIIRGVTGVYATDGTAGTYTIAGTDNVLTFTNGGTLIWCGLVWGD